VLRAYVSDLALPARRARALAVVDASFPTAGILGLPLVGWLIEGWGWSFPIWIFAGLCLVSALVMAISLPTTERTVETTGMLNAMITLIKKPKVIAALVVSTLVLMIFTLFFLFWALLLKEEFQFSPLKIGLTGTLVGIAELFGLIVAGLIVDQLGKRRGTLIGLSACILIFPLFLFVGGNINLIRLLLVLFMIMFEFGITASIPLIAEQTIENRATLFCMVSLGNTLGAGISPPLATYLWSVGGTTAVVLTGSALTLVAVLLVYRYLFDNGAPGEKLKSITSPQIHTL
jgi:predicted MFS family arabinose efflux permease